MYQPVSIVHVFGGKETPENQQQLGGWQHSSIKKTTKRKISKSKFCCPNFSRGQCRNGRYARKQDGSPPAPDSFASLRSHCEKARDLSEWEGAPPDHGPEMHLIPPPANPPFPTNLEKKICDGMQRRLQPERGRMCVMCDVMCALVRLVTLTTLRWGPLWPGL